MYKYYRLKRMHSKHYRLRVVTAPKHNSLRSRCKYHLEYMRI